MQYECEKCGEVHTFTGRPEGEDRACSKCGGTLRLKPAPASRSGSGSLGRGRRRHAARGLVGGGRFEVLRFVGYAYLVAALVMAVLAIIGVIDLSTKGKITGAIVVLVVGILTAITYVGAAEVIRLFITVEDSSQRSANALERIEHQLASRNETDD